jgi:hypothetical protein
LTFFLASICIDTNETVSVDCAPPVGATGVAMPAVDRSPNLLSALFQRPLPEVLDLLQREQARRRGRQQDDDLLALIARHRHHDHPDELLARTDLQRALARLAGLPVAKVFDACQRGGHGPELAAGLDVVLALHACRDVWRGQGVPTKLLVGGVWFELCGMPLPTPAQAGALLPLRGHVDGGFQRTFALLRVLARQND